MSAPTGTVPQQPNTTPGRLVWWFWLGLLLMVVLKLAVMWGQPFAAHMAAGHDDALFARLANEIFHGRWLGDYNCLTLIKGPFYPMFIATSRWCRTPLPIAEQLLYIVAAVAGVWALRPRARNGGILLAGAFVLLYGPYSWGELPARFSRDSISSPLAVLVIAGVCGMLLRRGRGVSAIFPWAVLCGLTMSALWLAREEAIWLVGPAIALCSGAALHEVWRGVAPARWGRSAVLVLVPVICAAVPVLAVCEANRRHYGVFQVVELKAPEFEAAYGSLTRVGQKFHRQYVPCPADARAQIYAVSPTFRALQPYLEGDVGRRWSGLGVPTERPDMQGGWFIWALRESAVRAGVHGTTGPNLAWYQQLADEVNAACDSGKLPAGPRHSTLVTPFSSADLPAIWASLTGFAKDTLLWTGTWSGPLTSDGTAEQLEMAADLVRTPFVPAGQRADASGWVVVAGRSFIVQVLTPDGRIRPFTIQWQDSDDVRQYFERQGIAAAAGHARFALTCPNSAGMILSVRDGETELGRITLNAGNHVESGNLYAHIDRVGVPKEGRMAGWRAAVVKASRLAVQVVAPVMTLLCIVWLVITAIGWRQITLGPCAAVLLVILAAVVIRTGLFAYINATTYPARLPRYAAPGMVLLSYGWLVMAAGSCDWLARRRAKRSGMES